MPQDPDEAAKKRQETERRRAVGQTFYKIRARTTAIGWKRLALELMEELRQIPGNRWNRRKGKDD